MWNTGYFNNCDSFKLGLDCSSEILSQDEVSIMNFFHNLLGVSFHPCLKRGQTV